MTSITTKSQAKLNFKSSSFLAKTKLKIMLGVLCVFLFSFPSFASTHSLAIKITNVKPKAGKIMIGLYNSPATWLSDTKQFRVLLVPADKSEILVTFPGLPAGEYAVSMYQDENSNGICDRSFFGIPIEKIGFSNNIVPRLFKPTFKECCVKAPKTINIQLVML